MVKFKAVIHINAGTTLKAKAIVDSVKSDDLTAPEGLTVNTQAKKDRIVSIVESQKSFKTFLATVDDLLLSIQVAQKTLKVI